MDAMEQKTERAAFEAWAEKNWMYVDVKDNSWEVWRAAIAAEREARQEAQRRLEALQERINHADKEKAQAVAAERERCAKLCESARFTGNTFPRTQMEQLRMDIAAAIRGN